MSSNVRTGQESAGTIEESQTVTDHIPAGADRLGIDSDGRIHYWTPARREMVIVEPTIDLKARIETVDVSPGADFKNYVEHAQEIAGWESNTYDEGWLDVEGAI